MKRSNSRFAIIFLAAITVVLIVQATTSAQVLYTPPGYVPPSPPLVPENLATPNTANPAIQPDGIMVPDVFGSTSNWQFSPALRKFVDALAPLGCTSANNLGQCVPIAVPDRRTFPGSDYYEIELRRYTEKMHSDLPNNTTLQGYVQVNRGTNAAGTSNNVAPAAIHYLGPIIIAQRDRPVRIKFVNKLPLESAAPFFLPVDTTVMGAGLGPMNADGSACNPVWDPRLGETEPNCAKYTKNRADLHLHGGFSPWISDGTPHQWITPAGEVTPYKKGASVMNVPDMWFDVAGNVIASCAGATTCPGYSNDPGPGAQTYYYTNQQSARLMFYHDHSYGITRLNVYAGEAAGYMIQDSTEADLVTRGIVPVDQIPLVIQDKSFVDANTIETLDPTWVWGTGALKPNRWLDATGHDIASCAGAQTCAVTGARKLIGRTPKTGDLWWPHVYMPAENPYDLGGVNPMGRWVYGLYFWPPTTGIKHLPVTNPYHDCSGSGLCNSPWEPPTMPAAPNPSWVAEAFVDTMMVNGTVFPKVTVEPKSYRLRILNASHDRSLNLQLYVADASVNANVVNPACNGTCATNTEVKMVPAIKYPAFPDWDASADQRIGGVPDPATAGPPWIQIGSEGGFLPAPAVIASKPISFVMDPTLFNVGNVNDGSLIMAPAERADVIVDFSQYAGKTLILYNDAPAAFPAFVPTNDYYTDSPDLTANGGHPGTKAGMGPNTRTIMQITVAAAPVAQPYNLSALVNEFASTAASDGVFKRSQHPVIVGQSSYDTAFNTAFPSVAPFWGIANIGDQKISFNTINAGTGAQEVINSYPMLPKALHDEMGAVWDEYGRMSAKLGVELPNTNNINQIFVMQNYQDPPTELLQDGKVQIWKLTHNGVDTHPLHFHLFDVQLINRVGWDGFVRLPWPNELGWKETVRVSPLEDTIVALRPKAPEVPFALPNSSRLLQPALPTGAIDGFMNLDPLTGQAKVPADTNQLFDYGFEYVWHCHILSHEEQDMMRSMVLRVATAPPSVPSGLTVTPGFQKNTLAWFDNSFQVNGPPYNTTLGFKIERCNGACDAVTGTFTPLADMTLLSSANPMYVDISVTSGTVYTYRVKAYNRYTSAYAGPAAALWLDGTSAPDYSSAVTSLTWQPATGVSLTADFASPHVAPVKFIALGTGATAPYQYRFWADGVVVQDYSVTRYWIMPVSTPTGTHSITVDVRTNQATTTPDISASLSYNLLPIIDTTPPITTAIPAAGAFLNPVTVYLSANEAGSIIKYTIDNSDPTTSPTAQVYATPIYTSATTTLKYYATDLAGNAEVVQTGLYELRSLNLNASVKINGGAAFTNNTAVTLVISATGATKMRFSNDGITYSADETYATIKSWTLAPASPDGPKTVYVRFTDNVGVLQSPVIAQITLDTIAPVTTNSPLPGTFISPVTVTLAADQLLSTIKYTLDGSNPKTSATALTYSAPFTLSATASVTFYATDPAGNVEVNKSAIYTIHTADLTVNAFQINGGAARTNSPSVVLTINATDATGMSKMRFSNDGITYTADEQYVTTNTKPWTLSAGDGVKSVYVRFTDGAGLLYDPVIAQITLDTTAPVISAIPAPGVFLNPLNVFLSANETGSIIKYTVDGSNPATSATSVTYSAAINITATSTLKYYGVDLSGNPSLVTTGTYTISTPVLAASVTINGGAAVTSSPSVTLALAATGMATMRFSNNGVNYSAPETFATSRAWTLDPGDGAKTVYVRFADGAGNLSNPVIAQITLDTTPPITAVSPIPGTYAPLSVTLTANEAAAIHYTTNGTTPTLASTVYTVPIGLAVTTTIKFFAVDTAGNTEAVQTGTWTINIPVLTSSIKINNGAAATNASAVVLSLSATTSNSNASITGMQFSNDGITYSAVEAYAASKVWTLAAGDGLKTVYVKFTETSFTGSIVYPPVSATIIYDTVAPVASANPVPGIYSSPTVSVALTSSETSTIYYTLNGTTPTAASAVYSGPIGLAATTTIKYLPVDVAGNAGVVATGTWTIQAPDLVSTVKINNGATHTNLTNVVLNITATSSTGVTTMQFSGDGTNYTAEEPYATSRSWTLVPGDGIKTVYARFRDGSGGGGVLYPPVTSQITLDTVAPSTTTGPVTGVYSIPLVSVTLTANEQATIYYTTDGGTPTTSSPVYAAPIPIAATTTVKYFAVDAAGNTETVKSGTWTIHSPDLAASVYINNGALRTNNRLVTLNMSAVDPLGVASMQFSNDGAAYTAEESYATTKAWTLTSGDGLKTVSVRFRDNTLPSGYLYTAITASITLDTTAPVSSANPVPGTYASAPVAVTLTAGEPATIYYTIDGSTPTTASALYTTPVQLLATSTLKYFAVDAAGNAETVKTGTWTINSGSLTASVQINGGSAVTSSPTVTLTLLASAPTTSIATMQFSNNGSAYSAEEPYGAAKTWALAAGDGVKTVYVRFRDNSGGGGFLFTPVTATIKLDTVTPTTTASPVQGVYSAAPVSVTLTASEPATIRYTIDGSAPTAASAVYTAPITVSAATTIRYFAVDLAGNTETAASGTWSFHESDLVASVQINNNATHTNLTVVNLTLSAVDPVGIATMQFSDDGTVYSQEEPYATTKAWTLPAGDGIKTVYVRFRDMTLPSGVQYPPVSASIILDTLAPVTSASPAAGTFASVPVIVALTANEAANIYYTTDGSTPTTASTLYLGTISLSVNTTIKYMAIDKAGNSEIVKTGTWNIHVPDLVGSIQINNGAAVTNTAAVTLTLAATDPEGVSTMQFSNNGVGFTAEEPYGTSKAWTLAAGNGPKTVYVRYKDGLGVSYGPFIANIALDTIGPVTIASPIPGIYAAGTVPVVLSANEQAAIFYTTDGSTPEVATALLYSAPILVSSGTVTIRYFAVDTAGNIESTIRTGAWTIDPGTDLVASVKINNSAERTNTTSVTLSLLATDLSSTVSTMRFSSDGINYTAEEPYATSRSWTVTPDDGVKTVYVRFKDSALGGGNLYPPVTASIVLDRTAPVTTISPVSGSYLSPISVTLVSNETSTIYYTVDGSTPTTASTVYAGPFSISDIAMVGYFAMDQAGNAEAARSATFTTLYPVTFVTGTNGTVTGTLTQNVGYSSSTTEVTAVPDAYYHFVNWTGTNGFVTTTSNPLIVANVTSGMVITANFALPDGDLGHGGTVNDALRALLIATGTIAPSANDLVHGDVAPLVAGKPQPDGRITMGDVVVIMRKAIGLVNW